jgi:HlyD family secretion protein
MWQYKIEYLARENAIVKKGDVIARFDGQRLKDEFITRDSQLAAAKKEAEKQQLIDEAKKDEEIARRKVEITDVSRSEIEKQKQVAEFKIATEVLKQAIQRLAQHANAVEARKKVQEAKIQNRQSRVDEINASLAKLELKAPKPGIVLYIPDGNDDKPAVGDTVYMGRTLLKIPSLDKIAAQAEFDESYISKVAVGQQVKVTLDAFPERSFQGVIEDLGKAFRQKSQRNPKIVFDAYISIDELDIDIMRPGMKATIALANTQDEVGK